MRFAFITDFIFLFMGAAPVFPPELVDCILDELATPPLSTLNCSLTGRLDGTPGARGGVLGVRYKDPVHNCHASSTRTRFPTQ